MHVPETLSRTKRLIPALIGFMLSGLAWGETAGRVNFASGDVVAVKPDNSKRVLNRGDLVNSGERLETGDKSRLQIRFTDGSFLSLQPNSVFSLDTYSFNRDKPEQSNLVFNFLRGSMRTISGAIGKINRSAYQIKTPTATIGIRGTDYAGVVLNNELILKVLSGVVNLTNAMGNADVPAGQTYSVKLNTAPKAYDGAFPSDPDPIEPDFSASSANPAGNAASAAGMAVGIAGVAAEGADMPERPRLENYENYNQFLQAMYAFKKAEAARNLASHPESQAPALNLEKIQAMGPMDADLETDTVDSPATPSLVTQGPETIDQAVARAQELQLPHYTPGENYHRSTFRSFPLKQEETPTLEKSSIADTFQLGSLTSQNLLEKMGEDGSANTSVNLTKADLLNKKVTMEIEHGDYILRIFGNIVQINGLSDMTVTLQVRP